MRRPPAALPDRRLQGAGERLVYPGSGKGLVYGRDGQARSRCQPFALHPGANRVRFTFADKALGEFRLRLQAVKQYQ